MLDKRWSSRSFVILAVLSVGVGLPSMQSAYADGKFFPEKAYKIGPDIPSQRAILVYKDDIEKLTIESSLDGKGQEFGWIIPLPSIPTEFRAVSPGLLQTFDSIVQRKIIHDLWSGGPIPSKATRTIVFWHRDSGIDGCGHNSYNRDRYI
jgi:hypothetical protein